MTTTTTTTTERQYTSDYDVWQIFVGGITPQEFISPFITSSDPIDAAIASLISDCPWEEEAPSWLASALNRYIGNTL